MLSTSVAETIVSFFSSILFSFACIARGGGGVDRMGVFKCLHKDLSIIDLIHHLVLHCRDLNHHRDPCAFL